MYLFPPQVKTLTLPSSETIFCFPFSVYYRTLLGSAPPNQCLPACSKSVAPLPKLRPCPSKTKRVLGLLKKNKPKSLLIRKRQRAVSCRPKCLLEPRHVVDRFVVEIPVIYDGSLLDLSASPGVRCPLDTSINSQHMNSTHRTGQPSPIVLVRHAPIHP